MTVTKGRLPEARRKLCKDFFLSGGLSLYQFSPLLILGGRMTLQLQLCVCTSLSSEPSVFKTLFY